MIATLGYSKYPKMSPDSQLASLTWLVNWYVTIAVAKPLTAVMIVLLAGLARLFAFGEELQGPVVLGAFVLTTLVCWRLPTYVDSSLEGRVNVTLKRAKKIRTNGGWRAIALAWIKFIGGIITGYGLGAVIAMVGRLGVAAQ